MVEAFFTPRLLAYEKRRQHEMARLEREALEADAKARFLKAILDGSLELRGACDEEIVSGMQINDLPHLSNPDKPDDVDSYDYLLRLRIDRVKAAAVEEAERAVLAARMAYEKLRDTTASALWLSDLQEFEDAWTAMEAHRQAATSSVGVMQKKKRSVKK
jgi:hypothetical protein